MSQIVNPLHHGFERKCFLFKGRIGNMGRLDMENVL